MQYYPSIPAADRIDMSPAFVSKEVEAIIDDVISMTDTDFPDDMITLVGEGKAICDDDDDSIAMIRFVACVAAWITCRMVWYCL